MPSFISLRRGSRLGEETTVSNPFLPTTEKAALRGLSIRPNTVLVPFSGKPQTAETVPAGRSTVVAADGAKIRTAGRVLLFTKTAGV